MCEISREFFICQQDSTSVYSAHKIISLLECETPTFVSPTCSPNSPHLNPDDYKVWGEMQTKLHDIDELSVWRVAWSEGNEWCKHFCVSVCLFVQRTFEHLIWFNSTHTRANNL